MARFVVIELSPDPSDNRPLGRSGEFLSGTYGQLDVAEFSSREAAEAAASAARNRRDNSSVSVIGGARK